MSQRASVAFTSFTSWMITSKLDSTRSSCSTKCRSSFRLSPASSRRNLQLRFRTSICWQKAGEFQTLTSRTRKSLLKQYDGWWVSFETLRENYTIKRADMNQLREYQRRMKERLDVMKPRYNLSENAFARVCVATAKAIEYRVWRQVGKSRRGAECATARHCRAQRLHDSFLLLRRVHQAQQTRRRQIFTTAERSEVCSRSRLTGASN